MEGVRVIIEVVAGVIPGTPIPEYTRRFYVTSDAWYMQGKYENKPKEAQDEVMQAYGMAHEYMRNLYNPQLVNWVRCNWIYL